MAGLLELGLLTGMGDVQRASPIQTLELLKADRAQGAAQGSVGSVPQGSPFQSQKVDLPQLNPIDTNSAMDAGAERASRDAKGPAAESADTLGIHPKVLDLAAQLGGGRGDDRDNALAKAGIGMALAGGQTGNFLTALAAGANQGMDTYHSLRAERAERAMKEFQLNQTANYQQGELANQQAQTKIQGLSQAAQQKYYEAQAQGVPAEVALRKAQAYEAYAAGKKNLALADDYGGGGNGIPTKVLSDAQKEASKQIAGVPFKTPEEQAAELQRRTLVTAKNMMTQRGLDTDIPAFSSIAPKQASVADPSAPPAKPKVPWMDSETAVSLGPDEMPLMGNPAVFMPINKVKSMAAQETFGAYDPGKGFNMGTTMTDQLELEVQKLEQTSGRPMKAILEKVKDLQPKQGIFVSPEQNFDRMHAIFNDIYRQYDQDNKVAFGPGRNKAVQTQSQQRLPIEERILTMIAGDKMPEEWPRFDSPLSGKAAPAQHDDGADLLAKYPSKNK